MRTSQRQGGTATRFDGTDDRPADHPRGPLARKDSAALR